MTLKQLFDSMFSADYDSPKRNGYMLSENMRNDGYDWWWHCFYAKNNTTGESRPFFIEYYIINPGLGGDEPIFGQLGNNKPSYVMIKAGTWGKDARQIHNFYGTNKFNASADLMDIKIDDGQIIGTDTRLVGSVSLSHEECDAHPEYMSQPGTMSWDLKVDKKSVYSVGYGNSELFRNLEAFTMFWHIHGLKAEFEGKVMYNNEEYEVIKGESYGYQDKNFGKDYTNPWLWLACNNFKDEKGNSVDAAFDMGGGNPEAFGISLGTKILGVLLMDGKYYEYNFTKVLEKIRIRWGGGVDHENNKIHWKIDAKNYIMRHRIVVDFSNPLDWCFKVNYENPRGEWNHKNCYNGGHAEGTIKVFRRKYFLHFIPVGWKKIKTLFGTQGYGEWGEY